MKERVDEVNKAIKMLKSIDCEVFYQALMIYDIAGNDKADEKMVKEADKIIEEMKYSWGFYDEYLRWQVSKRLDICKYLEGEDEEMER